MPGTGAVRAGPHGSGGGNIIIAYIVHYDHGNRYLYNIIIIYIII
jgi:hypothetical protein